MQLGDAQVDRRLDFFLAKAAFVIMVTVRFAIVITPLQSLSMSSADSASSKNFGEQLRAAIFLLARVCRRGCQVVYEFEFW